jgi:hypothetical protein
MPAGRPQQGTAWSPPLVGDFHALDKFGVLVFGDDKGNAPGMAKTEEKPAPEPAAKKDEHASANEAKQKLLRAAPLRANTEEQ